jgi:TonB family protein
VVVAVVVGVGAAIACFPTDATAAADPAAGQPEPNAAPAPAPAPALSKPPRLLQFVEATPPASLEEKKRADVVLTIDIDDKGKVTSVDVAQSAGAEFDAAAVAAAKQFVFEPGEADGKPVPVRITYSYHFVLKPAEPPPAAAAAETAPKVPVDGRVLRKGDRAPLAGVSVIVDDDAAQAATGEDGRFTFEGLPEGAHTLKLRGPTIAPADNPITLTAGKRLELTFFADAKEPYTSTVRGRRAMVETVEHTLQMEEIKYIPGTQGDTLKAVQNLPGVARAPFGIGQLAVWGTSPADTRVYLDGVIIPSLYHFGGLRSTVNSEMVQSLSFIPGGYQVDHGLGLGGVVEVESRQPRSDGVHGYAQADLVDASAMVEGPLTKTLTLGLAARRSWLDATLPLFTSNTFQLSPRYWDYQARLRWRPTARDELEVTMLGSDDQLDLVVTRSGSRSVTAASHIYFHRGVLRWMKRFQGGGTWSLVGSVGYDVPFQVGVQFGNVPTNIDARSMAYSLRGVFNLPVYSWLLVSTGIDFEGSRFVQDRAGVARPPTGGTTGASAGGFGDMPGSFGGLSSGYAADSMTLLANHGAPFLAAKLTTAAGRLSVTPQLRFQFMTFAGYPGTPDSFTHTYMAGNPRIAARYRLTSRLTLKGATGVYSQPPAPDQLSRVFGNPNLHPMSAVQYVAGADVDVTASLRVEMDLFYNDMSDLIVRGEDPEGPALVNDGRGRAYGAAFLVRQQLSRNLMGWVSYTLSRSERQDHPGEAWHPFQFDQTHILTAFASYRLPRGFQVGARYRYVTGNPTTPVVGAYFDANSDRYVALTGQPFSARLPAFNQLDLRVDKISMYLDVQNVFNTDNAEALQYNFDYTIPTPISGLPFLPILGIRGDF